MGKNDQSVGRVPSRGATGKSPPRRLRRLTRVWADRDGIYSYLLTLCVRGRSHVLDNEPIHERLSSFLLDSSTRYHWFAGRYVIMPDHMHLIVRMGYGAVPLGHWIKALKAVVRGLKPCQNDPAVSKHRHRFSGGSRIWRWQAGFHDHKLRSAESEARKWEYVCLNPVRSGLVDAPENWPFTGELVYDGHGRPRIVHGAPPLLEAGKLIQQE